MIRTNEYLEFTEPDQRAPNVGRMQGPPGFGQVLVVVLLLIALLVILSSLSQPQQQLPQEKQAAVVQVKPPAVVSHAIQTPVVHKPEQVQQTNLEVQQPQTPEPQVIPSNPVIELNIIFNGRTLPIKIYKEGPDGLTPAGPIPPELSYTWAGAEFNVYDRPNGNQIWSMPTGTRFFKTTFSFQSSPTCDWVWFITLDGQHNGFINVQRQP